MSAGLADAAGTVWETTSAAGTHALGERLGRLCRGGEVIALLGELGSGKTALVRGIAAGLEVPAERVSSPTFALIHEYAGRVPVYHVDLYRLDPRDALEGLGLEEYTESPGVTLIEWADRAPGVLPREHLQIRLDHADGDRRRLTLSPHGERYAALVAALRAPNSPLPRPAAREDGGRET